MRTDMEPFRDKRVCRAMALALDRSKLAKGLMLGRALEGNDSPFAPVYPSTDTSVPQRHKDIAEAKALRQAAGAKDLKVTLSSRPPTSKARRGQAGQIQRLLLDETPIIFAYFYDFLTVTSKSVHGVQPTAISQLFLEKATKA